MIEKEFPVFAFEEMRRFGVSIQEGRNEISILAEYLDSHKIERKPKKSVFNVFVEVLQQQYRRDTPSFYNVIRYQDYILLEFLIEYYDYENIDKICSEIENCNTIFIEKGDEGLKELFKSIIKAKGKQSLELGIKYGGLDTIHLVRVIKNPIQVEKTEQEQTLKITYKIDL